MRPGAGRRHYQIRHCAIPLLRGCIRDGVAISYLILSYLACDQINVRATESGTSWLGEFGLDFGQSLTPRTNAACVISSILVCWRLAFIRFCTVA
jgi:hypothetical protein